MFENLQKKWKVSPRRLWVILAAFAIGGSLCGFLGKKLMAFTGIEKGLLYFICYIIIITLLWPLCVVLISSLLGEYAFFKNYLIKISYRLGRKKSDKKYRIAIFASGGGSNAEQIMKYFPADSDKKISVRLVVSNKTNAGVLKKAENYKVPFKIITEQDLKDPSYLIKTLETKGITHIVLAGFLRKMPIDILVAYPDKIINIHPALLPKYGGKGMYGHYVHESVKANKESETGISIHLVNDEYDKGKLIFQKSCLLEESDTAEEIAAKVLLLEHSHFAPVIEDWIMAGEMEASLNYR